MKVCVESLVSLSSALNRGSRLYGLYRNFDFDEVLAENILATDALSFSRVFHISLLLFYVVNNCTDSTLLMDTCANGHINYYHESPDGGLSDGATFD